MYRNVDYHQKKPYGSTKNSSNLSLGYVMFHSAGGLGGARSYSLQIFAELVMKPIS